MTHRPPTFAEILKRGPNLFKKKKKNGPRRACAELKLRPRPPRADLEMEPSPRTRVECGAERAGKGAVVAERLPLRSTPRLPGSPRPPRMPAAPGRPEGGPGLRSEETPPRFLRLACGPRAETGPRRINIHEAAEPGGAAAGKLGEGAAPATEEVAVGADRAAQVSAPPSGLDLFCMSSEEGQPAPRRSLAAARSGLLPDRRRGERDTAWAKAAPSSGGGGAALGTSMNPRGREGPQG